VSVSFVLRVCKLFIFGELGERERERERERGKGSSRFFSVTDRYSAVGGGACFFNQIAAGEAAGGRGRTRRSLGKKGAQ